MPSQPQGPVGGLLAVLHILMSHSPLTPFGCRLARLSLSVWRYADLAAGEVVQVALEQERGHLRSSLGPVSASGWAHLANAGSRLCPASCCPSSSMSLVRSLLKHAAPPPPLPPPFVPLTSYLAIQRAMRAHARYALLISPISHPCVTSRLSRCAKTRGAHVSQLDCDTPCDGFGRGMAWLGDAL